MKKPSATAIARKLIWKKTIIIVQKMNKNTPIVIVIAIATVILTSLGIAGYAMINTTDFHYRFGLKFQQDKLEVETEIKKESAK